MRAKKLLGSGESWRKQACSLTLRQLAWASVMPQLSLLPPPPRGKASLASSDHLGYFRYRVLCALGLVRRQWAPVNICSPSPANHNRAPGGSMAATILPQGHSGKSGSSRNMWGFLQKHGHRDARSGHGAQVKSGQLESSQVYLYYWILDTQSQWASLTLTCSMPSNYQELLTSTNMKTQEIEGFCHLKVLNHVVFQNDEWQSALINEPMEFPLRCWQRFGVTAHSTATKKVCLVGKNIWNDSTVLNCLNKGFATYSKSLQPYYCLWEALLQQYKR